GGTRRDRRDRVPEAAPRRVVPRAPEFAPAPQVEGGELVRPADDHFATLIDEDEGGALDVVRDLQAALARGRVERDEVVAVCDDDRGGVRERDVRDPLVRALVAPEDFAARRLDGADAVRPARDHLAVREARELAAR